MKLILFCSFLLFSITAKSQIDTTKKYHKIYDTIPVNMLASWYNNDGLAFSVKGYIVKKGDKIIYLWGNKKEMNRVRPVTIWQYRIINEK